MAFSEDTKERILRAVDITKTIVHYGWVPFVIYVGFVTSQNRPNLIKVLSPLS
ncbi:hypothetical protein GLX27_000205 [Malassezia furfur]|uniref:Tom7-domain-containing protein n=1 Tax=Malassezia furfur TaxID=55194 RepID=A0ABY8EII2_MALFU|nr:hypothetical protein GLX27_000205 [Malassezia furfur]